MEPEQCSYEEWRESQRLDQEQAALISERMYQRYVKDRLDGIPHEELTDEYGKESAWFLQRFEESERHYQAAMKKQAAA